MKTLPILYSTIIGTGICSGLLFHFLNQQVFTELEPLFYRVFFWKSSLYFVLSCAGIFLILIGRIWLSSTSTHTGLNYYILCGFFFGVGTSGILTGLTGTEILRPQPVAWHTAEGIASHELNAIEKEVRAAAKQTGRPVLYYFHADWCAECPDFERFVLGNPLISPLLRSFHCVKLDVTRIEDWEEHLHLTYEVHGLPAIAFQDRHGSIIKDATMTGGHVSLKMLQNTLRNFSH